MLSLHATIAILTLLLMLCVFAGKFLSRFGVSILLLFIGAGMLLGSEGIFGVYFDNPYLTREIGNIALCFIMFFGGMDTRWKSIKPVVGRGLLLSTVGVVLTALLVGMIAMLVTGMSLESCLLLGAIVSSTDAASVFSTLRSQRLELKGNIAPLLEFESGSNDPMAYMLTIAMIGVITQPQNNFISYGIFLLREFGLGAVIGTVTGFATVFLLNKIRHNIESMYIILGISLMVFTYAITSLVEGNCFLAVYAAGLIIGNSSFYKKVRLIVFFDGFSWLAQVIMFLTLGLQVFPRRLVAVSINGFLIAFALIFVIRPLVVTPILALFKTPLKHQLFISLAGFRGAASIVFATYPLTAGLSVAQDIFDIVFFISLCSIIIQGTLLKPAARQLRLIKKVPERYSMQSFNQYADEISDLPVLAVYVPYGSPVLGRKISELGLPDNIRIVAIRQKERYSVPSGQTVLSAGDRMLLTSFGENNLMEVCEKLKLES